LRGPDLTMVETTAVLPEGRITPEDSGIWDDSHNEPLRQVVDLSTRKVRRLASGWPTLVVRVRMSRPSSSRAARLIHERIVVRRGSAGHLEMLQDLPGWQETERTPVENITPPHSVRAECSEAILREHCQLISMRTIPLCCP